MGKPLSGSSPSGDGDTPPISPASGVTRVGDTRGGNWGCHSSIFSWKPENQANFFAHRCHYHYRFLLLLLGCHPLQGGVSPFLPVRPRTLLFLHYSL